MENQRENHVVSLTNDQVFWSDVSDSMREIVKNSHRLAEAFDIPNYEADTLLSEIMTATLWNVYEPEICGAVTDDSVIPRVQEVIDDIKHDLLK